MISTSLSGEFNYLDKNSGKVSRRVDGHSKAITALTITDDDSFFTGSYDGRVYGWKYGAEGDHTVAVAVEGDGHKNQITSLTVKGDDLVSVAMDDTLRSSSVPECRFSDKIVSTGSLPSSVAISDDKVSVVASDASVLIYSEKLEKIGELEKLDFTPSVVDISRDGKTVFVGGKVNRKGL